jgi:hypothetical protein
MTPAECFSVDLYWQVNGDVFFVQIGRKEPMSRQRVGRHVRLAPSGYVNFVVIVPEQMIDSLVVERELCALVKAASYADTNWTVYKKV